jgi:hypothetical protein
MDFKDISSLLSDKEKAALYDRRLSISYFDWTDPRINTGRWLIGDWGCGCCGMDVYFQTLEEARGALERINNGEMTYADLCREQRERQSK